MSCIFEKLALLGRARQTVSVYLACARLTAATLYTDGLMDAVEALGGSRQDLPETIRRLLGREHDLAGTAIGPIFADCEERLEELRREIITELTSSLDEPLAAGTEAFDHA